ncbi:MAG TPA: MBL fold metallo-hydrolase [Thermodesulfobacteriota bacterium]|nr:MBL fold metallo-hydrolase [Thermodesulfobacteriota bacterium]
MKIHTIDHHFFKKKVIASYLIENGGEAVLIETGPDTTFHNLEKSLNDHGYSIEDIRNVFVTHIHLDHSGAAWRFADAGARIHVHPFGARHLADPAKLVASARRIYKEQMDTLWGEIRPIQEEKIYEIGDGEKISVGGIDIRAVETLGHASHHHSYLVDDVLFTGDVAGVRIDNGPVLPPTPPPDLNVELWQASIRKILSIKPQALYLTHFSKSEDAEGHMKELEGRLLYITEWAGEKLKQGKTEEEMVAEMEMMFRDILVKAGADKQLIEAYELADPFWMNVGGLVRYWNKFRT